MNSSLLNNSMFDMVSTFFDIVRLGLTKVLESLLFTLTVDYFDKDLVFERITWIPDFWSDFPELTYPTIFKSS